MPLFSPLQSASRQQQTRSTLATKITGVGARLARVGRRARRRGRAGQRRGARAQLPARRLRRPLQAAGAGAGAGALWRRRRRRRVAGVPASTAVGVAELQISGKVCGSCARASRWPGQRPRARTGSCRACAARNARGGAGTLRRRRRRQRRRVTGVPPPAAIGVADLQVPSKVRGGPARAARRAR